MAESPLEQFAVKKIVPLHIGGLDVSFTNASLFMVIAVALITLFMVAAMRPKAMPARCHSDASAIALAMTMRPISAISPHFSAIGMNSPGETMPRVGCFHRTSASTPHASARRNNSCQISSPPNT